jgi:hypothetical protein
MTAIIPAYLAAEAGFGRGVGLRADRIAAPKPLGTSWSREGRRMSR